MQFTHFIIEFKEDIYIFHYMCYICIFMVIYATTPTTFATLCSVDAMFIRYMTIKFTVSGMGNPVVLEIQVTNQENRVSFEARGDGQSEGFAVCKD